MTRRGPNEGTVRLRPDGYWEARVLVASPDGRRVRRSLFGKTRAEVRTKLTAALQANEEGVPVPGTGLTVGICFDQWLESIHGSVRPKTYSSYASNVKLHLAPGLGHRRLGSLTPQQVNAFLAAKTAAGLSPRTVGYLRALLRQALGQAERWGHVSRNVAMLAQPPRIPRREIHPLTQDQARTFLDAIRGDRLEAIYLVAIGMGLRQGEILGLAWSDVDLEARHLTVRFALQRIDGTLRLVEPKSATSHRIVALPDFVADGLRAQRVRQLEERLLAGSRWHEDERDLVFRTTIGAPLDGIAVTRRCQASVASAGLPRQRFHDLRHACASLMLARGVAPRVVMETLGHSQISLTLNTYSHVIPALGRAAADGMDDLLGVRSEAG